MYRHHLFHDYAKPRLHTCEKCHRPLVLIDYHDKILKGCISCNLWGRVGGRAWTHLPHHDLQMLREMMQHMAREETESAA
jgi:hypothetical protein